MSTTWPTSSSARTWQLISVAAMVTTPSPAGRSARAGSPASLSPGALATFAFPTSTTQTPSSKYSCMLSHYAEHKKLTPVCSVGNHDLANFMDAIFKMRDDGKAVSSFPTCFLTIWLRAIRAIFQTNKTANHVFHKGRLGSPLLQAGRSGSLRHGHSCLGAGQ